MEREKTVSIIIIIIINNTEEETKRCPRFVATEEDTFVSAIDQELRLCYSIVDYTVLLGNWNMFTID